MAAGSETLDIGPEKFDEGKLIDIEKRTKMSQRKRSG